METFQTGLIIRFSDNELTFQVLSRVFVTITL